MEFEIRLNCEDDAYEVRERVFMDEQGYKDEFDDIDDRATHLTIYSGEGELVGCARVYAREPGSPDFVLGRVAVLPEYRGQGYATELICAAEDVAREMGADTIRLHAQEYIESLYGKQGYRRIAEVDYEDEGQPHIWMEKLVDATDDEAV